MPGFFISVEGGEGVGKSLFIKNLAERFNEQSILCDLTFEPGGTKVAFSLREIFVRPPEDEPLEAETEFLIVSAARAQHVKRRILPDIRAGKWVLCDRFADSSRVYQGKLAGISGVAMESIIQFSTSGCEPDLTFVLDCDVRVAMKRLAKRTLFKEDGVGQEDTGSRFDQEKFEFHEKVRDGFLELAERFPQRIVVLDAGEDSDAVLEKGWDVIKSRFLK